MKKKTVLIHSNFCKAFTGFGKNQKNVLKYLYNTGKYKIVEAANMKMAGEDELNLLPWDCYGCVSNEYNSRPEEQKRMDGYGFFEIDKCRGGLPIRCSIVVAQGHLAPAHHPAVYAISIHFVYTHVCLGFAGCLESFLVRACRTQPPYSPRRELRRNVTVVHLTILRP